MDSWLELSMDAQFESRIPMIATAAPVIRRMMFFMVLLFWGLVCGLSWEFACRRISAPVEATASAMETAATSASLESSAALKSSATSLETTTVTE